MGSKMCGEPGALSLLMNCAVLWPVAVGRKTTNVFTLYRAGPSTDLGEAVCARPKAKSGELKL